MVYIYEYFQFLLNFIQLSSNTSSSIIYGTSSLFASQVYQRTDNQIFEK